MKEELGDRWLRADLFRFGASSLLTDIERQLEHFVTGRYAAGAPACRCVVDVGDDRTARRVASTVRPQIFETDGADGARRRRAMNGPAPESDVDARLARQARRVFGHFIDGAWTEPGVDCSRRSIPATAKTLARVTQRHGGRRRRRGRGGARGAPGVEGARAARARALSVRARARRAEAFAPARRAREPGQRQVDPRDARHRHPARGAPLLPSRRLGAAARHANSPATRRSAWSGRSFRGTSRCSCWRGRSRRRSRRETRWCSSRPSSRRSPRCAFAEIVARRRPAARRAQHHHRRRRRPARRSSSIRTSTRSRSPARPTSAASSARRRPARGKKLTLELGGKSPFIVFDDADLDSVVEGVVDAIWFNQGQVCCAGSRLLVQEGIADRLIEQAARAHGEAARRLAARQGRGHGRDRRAGAARAHPRPGRAGRRRRRDDVAAVVGLSHRGLLLSADAVHRRRSRRRRSRRSRSSARCW